MASRTVGEVMRLLRKRLEISSALVLPLLRQAIVLAGGVEVDLRWDRRFRRPFM